VFQILKNPNFNFMSRRNLWLTVSAVAVVASLVVIAVIGVNRGIEFTGGTELTVKYADRPDVGEIRSALRSAGLPNPQVTTIGAVEENEIYIRVGLAQGGEAGGSSQDVATTVIASLTPASVAERRAAGMVDLNKATATAIGGKLLAAPGLSSQDAERIAAGILELRRENAIFLSVDDIADVEGMTPEVLEFLKKQAFVGPFSLRGQSFIGPAIGRELMQKALFAILGSLAGMLIYIWIRFELQWGLAAVVALTHDTLITLGLFVLFGKEMSLPVVAAFLTLIGYSVNDTVVVFDRVREDIKLKGSTLSLEAIINLAINQTLSRTLITSGLTWVVVVSLLIFGGGALNAFAFVLVIGVLVGTYSSIYIASPILLLWRQLRGRPRQAKKTSSPARRRRSAAKKVQSGSA
jgi:preprotein translocase subunit SecF